MNPSRENLKFDSEAWVWWKSVNNGHFITSEEFEKIFSNKWISYTKMEAMYRIQYELKEAKEDIKNKGDEISKI
jgi:hypothetical protein